MNYPWDCFTSAQNPHPQSDWWKEVCKRFVDTSRVYSESHFRDVNSKGYIAGGDWYVIHGGRQDYVNYYHDCLELTMEISSDKTVDSENLPEYWRFLHASLVNYIEEIRHLPGDTTSERIASADLQPFKVYVRDGRVVVDAEGSPEVRVCDVTGRWVSNSALRRGVYFVWVEGFPVRKVIVL